MTTRGQYFIMFCLIKDRFPTLKTLRDQSVWDNVLGEENGKIYQSGLEICLSKVSSRLSHLNGVGTAAKPKKRPRVHLPCVAASFCDPELFRLVL